MTSIRINAVVRLKEDVPELRLNCGDKGVVASVWISSAGLHFEVEFPSSADTPAVYARLLSEQLELVDSRLSARDGGAA